MIKVTIVRSGDGAQKVLGEVETLTEATKLLNKLDDDFHAWEVAGFPEKPDDDVLTYYEGSDVFAEDTVAGTDWIMNPMTDAWETW